MEKPYKIRKALVKFGNSVGVVIPKFWVAMQEKRLKVKRINFLDVECNDDKLVITVSN
jgi:antitoxin component of MazEF toxin-antitoxin module